ncbi:DUF308 domain-containing protein [Lysinibacter sp. HNR]|uniref:HdeD family acid-resistance protein n=1 Tax=Lysinibacter sp. HNR TaxID=3031408 RepID=UPI0024349E80|nr:DUF308 domain-containing protein [Lysinibacter sp. HNR]WGD38307.1 DUF308 domain-containing protein [Lysinibacter sp. HNR]
MSGTAEEYARSVRSGINAIWWLYLIRGICAIIFGIIALSSPGVVAGVLAVIIGIYLIIDGVFIAVGTIVRRQNIPGWGWGFTRGIVTTLAGVFIVILPTWSAAIVGSVIVWTMIILALLAGVYGAIRAFRSRRYNSVWGWGMVSSVLTLVLGIIFAILVVSNPSFAVKALVWVAGFWALIVGLVLTFMAVRVRRELRELGETFTNAV